MCVIEHKKYIDSDGERTVPRQIPCRRATETHLCDLVEHRDVGPIYLVKAAPRETQDWAKAKARKRSESSSNVVVTEGFNGRRVVYRDLSKRSSNNSSVRGSSIMSDRSPESSASSTSYVDVRPKAPTPPSAASGSPYIEAVRSPLLPAVPPTSPPDPTRIVTPEGTAIYDRPPSLELPRAVNNERIRRTEPARQTSASSMKAEVDVTPETPTLSKKFRKPNITIDTSARPSGSSLPAAYPRASILRRESQRETCRRDSKQPERSANEERQRRAEYERQRQEEDHYQAQLERLRLSASDRRQAAREERAPESLRERHRREAEQALTGQRDSSLQSNIAAEMEQMAREREDAAARDAASRSLTATRTRASLEYPPSPTLTRAPTYPVQIHQQYPPRRSNTIEERGEAVLRREQAKGATQRATERLTNVLGEGRSDDREVEDLEREDGWGQERHRRRKEKRRERPAQEFYE